MKKTLNVKGMHCKSCEVVIGDELKELGIKSKLDHKTGVVEVDFDEKKVSLDKIKQLIKKEGYSVA